MKTQTVANTATNTQMAILTINLTNSTGKGALTLAGFTNGLESPPVMDGNPPLSATLVPENATVTLLQAAGGETSRSMEPTKGDSTWNLPNGNQLTISWFLNPRDPEDNEVRFSMPTGYFAIEGADSPVIVGNNYTYNLTLSLNG